MNTFVSIEAVAKLGFFVRSHFLYKLFVNAIASCLTKITVLIFVSNYHFADGVKLRYLYFAFVSFHQQ